jgi:hypothetical protein
VHDSDPGRGSTHSRYTCSQPHQEGQQPCPVEK